MLVITENPSSPLQPTITLRVKKKIDDKRQSFLKRLSLAPLPSAFDIGLLERLAPPIKVEPFGEVLGGLIAKKPPIKKMADSTFAEIFFFESAALPVIKILPIASTKESCKSQDTPIPSSLELVLHEYLASQALFSLRKHARYNIPSTHSGFVDFSSFHIVKGRYPKDLVDARSLFSSNHSKNPGFYSIYIFRSDLQ